MFTLWGCVVSFGDCPPIESCVMAKRLSWRCTVSLHSFTLRLYTYETYPHTGLYIWVGMQRCKWVLVDL